MACVDRATQGNVRKRKPVERTLVAAFGIEGFAETPVVIPLIATGAVRTESTGRADEGERHS